MTLDIGSNLFSLGLIYLLLPIIIGAVVLTGALWFLRQLIGQEFLSQYKPEWVIIFIAVVLILLVIGV